MLPLHFLFTNTAEYQDCWVYREVSSCSFKLKLISTLHLEDNVHVQLLSLGRQDSCVISGKRWRERIHQRKVMPTFCFSRVMPYKHVLSRFSTIRLFATPWTVVHQAPLSMGFSRQEYWSGLSCPPPGDLPRNDQGIFSLLHCQLGSFPLVLPGKPSESVNCSVMFDSLCNPMDCSPPGSLVLEILQARTLVCLVTQLCPPLWSR